jgi:zinc D-Ala-D-Ala dipeptidase
VNYFGCRVSRWGLYGAIAVWMTVAIVLPVSLSRANLLMDGHLLEEQAIVGINASKTAQLVDIRGVNPKIALDMRYATTNNFLKRKVYAQARCLLRASAADRLSKVQNDLAKQGLGLKLYDCYRPLSVQKQMWKIKPDSRFVANPDRGSRHNRGSAVDLTLIQLKTQKELPMPSGFDEFTERAYLDYPGGSAESRRNREILQQVMKKQGFLSIDSEWWHFDDPNWQQYRLMDTPLEQIKK